jgi:hypothetical protein
VDRDIRYYSSHRHESLATGTEATYKTQGPKHGVIDGHPCLLAEPGNVLALLEALRFGEGGENVLHGSGAQAGQEDDAKEYEVTIVPADAVIPGVRIIVREVKVLGGVVPGARHAVGEEEEGEEVEGEA